MSGIFIHREPENAVRRHAPLGTSQAFDVGDPVGTTSQQLTEAPQDGTEVLAGEYVGFAAEPATGIHSASRTGAANGFGAAENDIRTYYPAKAPGLQLRTRNFWATGAAGTQAAKTGADIGRVLQLSCENATSNWGVEETAGTTGTDAVAYVDAVLDDDMQLIDADATLTAGDGWIVFHMVGDTQEEDGGA